MKGFTLVEVLVALAILGIGLTASTPLLLRSISQAQHACEMSIATQMTRNIYALERAANRHYSLASRESLMRVVEGYPDSDVRQVWRGRYNPETGNYILESVYVPCRLPVVSYRRTVINEMSNGSRESFATYITPSPIGD